MNSYKIGLDIGSTTIKIAVIDADNNDMIYSAYERHNAKIKEKLSELLAGLYDKTGDATVSIHMTGSVGMGVAEKCGLPFVQEVVAATYFVRHKYPHIKTLIDIGGEDAKVVMFNNGKASDLRMNGNCAGGTGAFIDQMAILLDVPIEELNKLAEQSNHIYPIASRCGVFSKTDIQNLIAKNASREDIAASIFHAVAVQVIVTLAHGYDMTPPILFCGGPLTFIPALRHAFENYLKLSGNDIILPENSNLLPAWGAALSDTNTQQFALTELINLIEKKLGEHVDLHHTLPPIFKDRNEYGNWEKRMMQYSTKKNDFHAGEYAVTIGIDSGSTTTKIVVLDEQKRLMYSYYHTNDGNPVKTAENGLKLFHEECARRNAKINVVGSCSTGYGEDLIKAAFGFDNGIIETMAHYMAAKDITKDVSFILDIGGQDMKAIFVNDGIIERIEINEACSSGCGSFIETFAKSMGYDIQTFAQKACEANNPYDLGTRCTVFMNSKVKQALREGAGVEDIAAGLSYSVIKNCLYKVLRIKNFSELGEHIVVQGGTMKNDSVVKAFELLTGKPVFRSDMPELMGALGCAIYAKTQAKGKGLPLGEIIDKANYATRQQQCHGCENNCLVTRYKFDNGNTYFSGNRCEKVFTNKGGDSTHGTNVYEKKLALLFNRNAETEHPLMTIGIPRCLNMYEDYPFWHTLFTSAGINVILSAPSTMSKYETSANMVMSDNICFPAKVVHSHIKDLVTRHPDRIFMPFVVFEKLHEGANSYNCPIVTGYSEVVKSVHDTGIPIDSPIINFKDTKLLYKQCKKYLADLGVKKNIIEDAFMKALLAMNEYESNITEANEDILHDDNDRLKIVLAGRPYHTDPLIQHKLSDMIAAMGADVLTDDVVRDENLSFKEAHFVPQWTYTNRILKAAQWTAEQGNNVQFMQMTSFGCGPDAFLTDETRSILKRHGKTMALLKIDDVNNIGSIKLRVRSVLESLRLSIGSNCMQRNEPFATTPAYTSADKKRKIIIPFFTPFISPLIPPLMELAGYEVENLPLSDNKSCDLGLKYANNEVCYPATLITGDIIKAFEEKRYDPATTSVAITQTGGQCRATNYISLIKKALTESGYDNVPVVSLTFGSGLYNEQEGFKVNWFKLLPIILASLIFSDCIAKFYHASIVRETQKGAAEKLKDKYLAQAAKLITHNDKDGLTTLLSQAAEDFNAICKKDEYHPRVGIVGEIYLKFNPFAQKNVCSWFAEHGIEVVPPMLTDFFIQSFVNIKVKQKENLEKKKMPDFIVDMLYKMVWKRIRQISKAAERFALFTPLNDIFKEADEAKDIINLCAQFGEGWLLPGEIVSMYKQGIKHIVSLQPFGCIANHIVAKGVEKRIKRLYPDINMLYLDFDSGVSDVNIINRLLLFANDMIEKNNNGQHRTNHNQYSQATVY